MRFFLLFIGLLLIVFESSSQVVDDTTKLLYGPETTRIIYEEDVLFNRDTLHRLDTLLNRLEDFTLLDKSRNFYSDLGNNGTALNPVFFQVPSFIGKTSGFNAYRPFLKQPNQFKYYDTKSPFIDVQAIFGGQGRSLVNFTFTQNVNSNWNVGIDIHRIITDKQIGTELNEGDRNSVSTNYDFFTYFKHPKQPYKLLANISFLDQKVDETGGVLVLDDGGNRITDVELSRSEFFQYTDSDIQLEDAQSSVNYSNIHIYHEYAAFEQFQIYHKLDRAVENNEYIDFQDAQLVNDFDTYRDFYDNFLIDPDSTFERARFTSFSNEIGLKGSISSVFYQVYLRRRDANLDYKLFDPNAPVGENYLGGLTQFNWKDKFLVTAKGEVLPTGEFYLHGRLESKTLNLSYTSSRYRPSYLVNDYFGNHYEWHNNFSQGFANEIKGNLNVKFGELILKPEATITAADDFFYFDSNRQPQQANSSALITRIGGFLNYALLTNKTLRSGFYLDNEVYFTNVSGGGSDLIRIPELFFNGRVYWKGNVFQSSVPVEIGFSLHGRSGYFANQYDPVTQQFYIQDDFFVDDFIAADVFVNMRIDKVFAFLKITHANQPNDDGYFVTPGYPGEPRLIDLGVRWLFFD